MKLVIQDIINDSVQKYHDHLLLVDYRKSVEVSFIQFSGMLSQVKNMLYSMDVKKGDIITIISENCIDLVVTMLGVISYGAIAKPLNPKLTASEIGKILEHSGSRHIFTESRIAIETKGVCLDITDYKRFDTSCKFSGEEMDETEGALLIYTSGSTGQPKGVLLSHKNIISNVMTAIQHFDLKQGHTQLCILPLFHTFGIISDLLSMIFNGGKCIIMETFNVSNIKNIEVAIKKYQVNSFSAVPIMYSMFLKLECNLKQESLQFCVSGAAPLEAALATQFRDKYEFPIIPAYGLTETTCFSCISPMDNIKYDAVGKPLNIQIKIISEDKEELESGLIGDVIVYGDSVIKSGYFRNSLECYSEEFPKYFNTGDLGYLDQEGYLYIVGRKKNMAIRGGEKVYCEDIDRSLKQFEGLSDVATIYTQKKGMDYIITFYVPESGEIQNKDIMSFLLNQIGKQKCPDKILNIPYIPRTATNKVKIAELQKLAEDYL